MFVEVNKNNFEAEVLNASVPVLADFNADWCGPCRMLKPILDEVSETRKDWKFVSINIDEEEELAEKYEISAIPCLVVFKNGAEFTRSVGLLPREDLEALLDA